MKDYEKYGVPTTFRIPPRVKQKLVEQASQKGMNLSQYLESLVLAPLEVSLKQQEELQRLQTEKEELLGLVKKLKQDSTFLDADRKKVVQILLKNEEILREAFKEFKSNKFDLNILVNKGFNFVYATHKASELDYVYIGVFHFNYVKFNNGKVRVIKQKGYEIN
jgi:hypothetical protein